MKSFAVVPLLLAAIWAHPAQDYERVDPFPLLGIEKRIAGGEIAKSNQFPYQVRLNLDKLIDGRRVTVVCGGSVLSNKYVITAAHCLEEALSGVVHFGATNVRSPEPTHVAIPVEMEHFIIHEKWDTHRLINDIAIIKLPQKVKFSEAIQPINLPKNSEVDLEGKMGVISGFGNVGNIPGTSNELRFVARKILPNLRCERYFRATFTKEVHICVDGSMEKSSCPGDSGGPLVITEADGSKTLFGLSSYGGISCVVGLPSIYTRVTTYLDWINEHLRE